MEPIMEALAEGAPVRAIDLREILAKALGTTAKNIEFYQSKLEQIGDDCDPGAMVQGALDTLHDSAKALSALMTRMAFAGRVA